ncbi:MAG: tRNA-specific 2-thiouridylase MnmA [Syntrophus sp. PtaB.Bin075]|nr:MAG: tRNA-specific 2-thiouridylase MnmA [Syntrophus sp. PtaB.Bin075]
MEGLHIFNGFSGSSEARARHAAHQLGIPLHVADVTETFDEEIVQYLTREYLVARTPNPCVVCNRKIKFKTLLYYADRLACHFVATGHYARVFHNRQTGRYALLRGLDQAKDQSYFLFLLGQEQLSRILFPLGELTKKEVRSVALTMGVEAVREKESQEICFIPDDDYKTFIERHMGSSPAIPGDIVDRSGRLLGSHNGIHSFTIGQRKGLRIAAPRPYYVLAIDREKNRVVVGNEEEQGFSGLIVSGVSWIDGESPREEVFETLVRIRYRHRGVSSVVCPLSAGDEICPATGRPADHEEAGDKLIIRFQEPQRAVAPGQAAVFYSDDRVIGGGWIEQGIPLD